jgi:hypothetical protein
MRTPRHSLIVFVLILGPALIAAEKTESLDGYAEWRKGDVLVVDGQRVRASAATKFKGKHAKDLASVQLGSEVDVKGTRLPDGSLLAREFEAKPNGSALFEDQVQEATNAIEAQWLQGGAAYEPTETGGKKVIGRMVESGDGVTRVRRIMSRLMPPYVDGSRVRVHVVDNKEWNAMAMGNGAVWVFTGIMQDMNDDELAIVLGHELAHYTHEHTRRTFKRAMWGQLLAIGAMAAAETIDSRKTQAVVNLAAALSLSAWQSGYGRDLEDQADRVGLRYAHEAGFDVTRGPGVWQRFLDKYGQPDPFTNFFFSDHSQASARRRNIERELRVNYK